MAADSAVAALLAADEPAPCIEINPGGASPFFILVDHAGARIPRSLGTLGLPGSELQRHIAWDIGALDVARNLARELDAVVLAQAYSRLVIDCNRDPQVASSIPAISEASPIPGNAHLDSAARDARRISIFEPYHQRIRQILDTRAAQGRTTILVAQHSMTPVYKGEHRPMHAAVLYNRDRRLAGALLAALRAETGLHIADNEPYFVSDATDYSVPRHAEARGLLHVEIEIRQDLVSDAGGQRMWASRLAQGLRRAAAEVTGGIA